MKTDDLIKSIRYTKIYNIAVCHEPIVDIINFTSVINLQSFHGSLKKVELLLD